MKIGKPLSTLIKILAVFIVVIISLKFTFKTQNPLIQDDINRYFTDELQNLKKGINNFKASIAKKASHKALKQEFLACRLIYKKNAVLTDYFNQYESRFLNSPAIERIESEISDRIIPPSGFQAIEQILFKDWDTKAYLKLDTLCNEMLLLLQRIENEPDRQYKFRNELVYDAIRSSIVQITTNGIAGFDSPLALHSIPESVATLEGIESILSFFKPKEIGNKYNHFEKIIESLGKCKSHLKIQKSYNLFDRLAFIKDYLDPLYRQVVIFRIESGIGIPEGRSAINYNATSIFSEDVININFYSPPEEYWITKERVMLGKALFSDPVLSGTKTRSCASCHQPSKAFTDGLSKPYSIDEKTILTRNTPTLWNSGFQTKQFYDSRSDILENQLGEVVHNAEEMKGSLKNSVNELKENKFYSDLFSRAYPKEKDPINTFTLANAIASYVRSLRSLNSRFDKYMRGDKEQLSDSEKRGFNLFMGKAKCATCHFIPLFNGVVPPFYADTESEVLGVPSTESKNKPLLDEDKGKYNFTRSEIHKFSFKTPTLRNIELTSPYMHNGVYKTLEEVLKFYNNGGGKGLKIAPPNQTLAFEKLNLSKKEINNIIAFMKALTDTSYFYQ